MGKKKKKLKKKLKAAEKNITETRNLLTSEELSTLKAFINQIQSNELSLTANTQQISNEDEPQNPTSFSDFTGELQSRTIKLHVEVREKLDAYCDKNKVTKKDVVNQAIWDYLQRFDEVKEVKEDEVVEA